MSSPFVPPPVPNQDAEQLLFEEENEMTAEEFRAAIGKLKTLMEEKNAAQQQQH